MLQGPTIIRFGQGGIGLGPQFFKWCLHLPPIFSEVSVLVEPGSENFRSLKLAILSIKGGVWAKPYSF